MQNKNFDADKKTYNCVYATRKNIYVATRTVFSKKNTRKVIVIKHKKYEPI